MKIITKQMSIILVDDDQEDRELFSEAISEIVETVNLKTFNDGSEIIEYFKIKDNRANLPSILFLDINMPLVNGLEALQILRTELKMNDLSIAMYSTSSLEVNIEEALILGANVYITKPTSYEKLKHVLYKVLQANLQFDKTNLRLDTFVLSV